MSSMLRATTVLMLLTAACVSSPARCDDGSEWDQARAALMQDHNLTVHQAVDRWRTLSATASQPFATYASFLISFPGFPMEEKIRGYAEKALERESPDPATLAAFFDKFPPLSSTAAGRYAAALTYLRRDDARGRAIAAWRGGSLTPDDEAMILSTYREALTVDDHDARMDALLWQGATSQAERQISFVSAGRRALFMERLALAQGSPPGSLGLPVDGAMMREPGYVYNRVVQARASGNLGSAINLLATRPPLSGPVAEPEKWVKELLTAARGAGADSAVRIASSIDDGFAPGTDISKLSYRLRDDYTSLMWLGGTKALWSLGDARRAAPLFYRYGAAAQTPGTRSKGFYWAGRAQAQAGDRDGASRYFEMAAQYPEYFYGQLSLERLGRPLPNLDSMPQARPSRDERAAFEARPITNAVKDVARDADWRTTVQFFREISDQAQSEEDHVLVADLAREIGRRDLAVILGQSAHADGYGQFGRIAFPVMPTPPGANWTMVHALTRQESQFAQNALSHAGARGLMQLMPGTAREQAGKLGLSYDPAALTTNATYNIQLGNGYFGRMMDYYGGAYPLAVGAYNAGPGNVNKWLAANGDPRTGAIDWVEWIEKIPIYETRNYIQRVLENAVVYDAIYPDHAYYKGDTPLSHFLGKRTPG
ncbi:lytic transglycosylase domain-containing protein [Novosphingobium album (ex Liu et al. 2023)]|uniref:Lytic transglycosylase domain-containing protein n=1 Tax=Novosphingobium album (ex Liu et al. 2023) TaxID=3031130 RepID=A0ABT5WNF7_9SPHN|nr:lytic transglycosylase domain-containing protein [Novosphingobium album (ex Liu et al. 2023)]MDE8651573.1 lytic transglycosylase domain-containing protein [Novosphingobium album (ex Liu et al. 2023)]